MFHELHSAGCLARERARPQKDAVRDVDANELATLLSDFVGNRKDGFLFCSAKGKPLSSHNVIHDNLCPAPLALKQARAGLHLLSPLS